VAAGTPWVPATFGAAGFGGALVGGDVGGADRAGAAVVAGSTGGALVAGASGGAANAGSTAGASVAPPLAETPAAVLSGVADGVDERQATVTAVRNTTRPMAMAPLAR